MRTGDLCIRQVVTATAEMPVLELTRVMRNRHVGCVVIVDKGAARKPIGIVTDRDIVVEVLAEGVDPAKVTVGDIMSGAPVLSHQDEDAMWALKLMRDKGIRRLPIVDGTGALVGILALDDLMQHLGNALADVAQLIGSERLEENSRRA
ncbi:MAG TPA: CBS domain-containing protein [Usitatibacter sp.]|nr:CBS domain-containing protein [Usitatibacter sp.]